MSSYSSLNKLVFAVLLLSMVTSCRKEIDFTEGDKVLEGAINSNEPFYQPWIDVSTPGISDITLIEQDFNGIYFTGVQFGLRKLFYFEGENSPTTIWTGNAATSANGEFTAMVFSASSLYVANNALPYAKCRIYSNYTTGVEFSFNLGGNKITDIMSIGNEMFLSGDFMSQTPFPASNYFDRVNKSTGYFLGMTGLESPAEGFCYGWSGFFACGKDMHSGRSIANWDGSEWIPYSSITERVTDVELWGDTLMIAGNLSNGRAILKERNGFEIPFDELINTAQSEADTRIKFLRSGDVIYAYGTVNFQNATFDSVLKYEAGSWSYLGKLNEIPTDLAILDGYLYAATASGIKKIKL